MASFDYQGCVLLKQLFIKTDLLGTLKLEKSRKDKKGQKVFASEFRKDSVRIHIMR
jgi:hypothetical protein